MRSHSPAMRSLAADVGGVDAGPVVAVGGSTATDVGGVVGPEVRRVRAPSGILEWSPEEMTVRVLAGTPVADLAAELAAAGQRVALAPRSPQATVGGALAVGTAGLDRLGRGPVRDAVLELTGVLADGRVVVAGGPTVKNVSGYDLCRLFVGSLGTLAILGEAVLRTWPLPRASGWFTRPAPSWSQVGDVVASTGRPASVLWDGSEVRVLLEGHPADLGAAADRAGLVPVAGPPDVRTLVHRWSMPPGSLATLADDGAGAFVAEVGVGVVHRAVPPPPRPPDPVLAALHRRLKVAFDPTGRLAPGRDPYGAPQ